MGENMAEALIGAIQKFSWILLIAILLFGWTSPVLMVVAFICMIAPVVFSFSSGRAWCGNFCPRNSFSNVILSKISPNKHIPKFYKSAAFRLLMFILLMSLFGASIYSAHGSLKGIGYTFLKMMLITTIMQISFGVFIHPNIWCSFCPMGTAASVITKFRKNDDMNIKISKSCIDCGICKSNCPLELDISKWKSEGEVKDGNCMKCRKCIKSCPQRVLTWNE